MCLTIDFQIVVTANSLAYRYGRENTVRLPLQKFYAKESLHKDFDVVGFGENSIDYLIHAPRYPEFNTKLRCTEYLKTAGGQIASAMIGLQRLGLRTAYAGRFGKDEGGHTGIESFAIEEVNTDFAEVIEGAQTQTAFIIIDEQSGERTILWNRDERLIYSADEAPTELARRGRVLHLDANNPAASVAMAQAAKASGAIVSADLDHVFDGIENLLPLVDILITSESFPLQLTGITDTRQSLAAVKLRYGCALVGATLGARGAIICCENQFMETAAFPVPGGCVDTTGAGDAFHAGFLYGLLQGEEIETSLKLACAVAALKCRNLGARAGLPAVAELNAFGCV